ncbi:MAG: metallophosphoesterase [Bacteroidales bacterium]|nr:metallophosphoesterase [Bacteroidales bacterium]
MKKYWMIACWLLVAATVQAQDLIILHTNDTHSQLETMTVGKGKGRGGISRRYEYFQTVRAEGPEVLVLDAGDYNQGTPYFTVFNGDIEVDLMNVLGYDVVALGNHELDNGMAELARRLKKANYATVCANYDFTGTPLEGLIQPYTMVERAGRRIGIIGLTAKLEGLVSAHCRQGLVYQNAVEVANRYAMLLRQEYACDMIIVLSHLGYAGKTSDTELAKNSRNIDMIIGGHSHTFLKQEHLFRNLDDQDVVVVQDGAQGEWVGRFDIDFQ